jgi:ribosome assembly protein YihI (activator of Der GTPase)
MSNDKKNLKKYSLDPKKVRRVQKYLGAKSETEALEQALDAFLTEEKLEKTHRKFVESKGDFVDTLGRIAR